MLKYFPPLQQRAASEETSDNTQLQSAFATEGANMPSFDYPSPMNYGLAPVRLLPCSSSYNFCHTKHPNLSQSLPASSLISHGETRILCCPCGLQASLGVLHQ